MDKKRIKKISNYAIVGGLGATLVLGLVGCQGVDDGLSQGGGDSAPLSSIGKEGAFVIIEKDSKGNYLIVEEFPSKETRIVLREDGKERILSQNEIDTLIKEEQVKIDAGTSELLQENPSGMGIGGAILSSMAGALLGSYIGNKLFNNPNYEARRNKRYQNPSGYSRSMDSFNKAKTTPTSTASTAPKSSGYLGSGSKNTQSSASFGG